MINPYFRFCNTDRKHLAMLNIRFFFIAIFFSHFSASGQLGISEKSRLEQLNLQGGLPEKLLSTRTAVLNDYNLTAKELAEIQATFERTGIDAIIHFDVDKIFAGKDVSKAFSDYLIKREVANLIFVGKNDDRYSIIVTTFSGKDNIIEPKQPAWFTNHRLLPEALKALFLTASSQQKKQNLLVIDVPEVDASINPILGNRNEFYATDLKVDLLAVQKTGDESVDKELEEIFTNNYPLKFKMVEPGIPEKELRRQGHHYVVGYVHTRSSVAKELLGYDMKKFESAFISVVYTDAQQQQLKTISSTTHVYKFYFKHIDSGNVFLGTKWDADLTWQQALLNHIRGMKAELRLN